jgi:hypothetical protein
MTRQQGIKNWLRSWCWMALWAIASSLVPSTGWVCPLTGAVTSDPHVRSASDACTYFMGERTEHDALLPTKTPEAGAQEAAYRPSPGNQTVDGDEIALPGKARCGHCVPRQQSTQQVVRRAAAPQVLQENRNCCVPLPIYAANFREVVLRSTSDDAFWSRGRVQAASEYNALAILPKPSYTSRATSQHIELCATSPPPRSSQVSPYVVSPRGPPFSV